MEIIETQEEIKLWSVLSSSLAVYFSEERGQVLLSFDSMVRKQSAKRVVRINVEPGHLDPHEERSELLYARS